MAKASVTKLPKAADGLHLTSSRVGELCVDLEHARGAVCAAARCILHEAPESEELTDARCALELAAREIRRIANDLDRWWLNGRSDSPEGSAGGAS